MRFNNFFLIVFLILTIFGSQSMSNCNPTPPPDPGTFNIQVSTVDTNNIPIPNTLIGLFVTENYYTRSFGDAPGCLVDTFYTNNSGYKRISYIPGNNNYYWVAVIPDHQVGGAAEVINYQLDTSLIVWKTEPLLTVDINIANYDSVLVFTNNLDHYCKNTPTNLREIPLALNYEKVTANAQFTFEVIPNNTCTIRVHNYLDGQIVTDSMPQIYVGSTMTNIQIN